MCRLGVLLVGSAIYQARITLSCFEYDQPESSNDNVMSTITPQLVGCSPMLTPQLQCQGSQLSYSTPGLAPRSAQSSRSTPWSYQVNV